jgi:hypothetical protein
VNESRFKMPLADLEREALIPLDQQVETQAQVRNPDLTWQPVPPFGGGGGDDGD